MKNHPERVRHCARRAGFTLIELLTVIAIISVLAGISMVAVPQYLEKAKITKTEANMKTIEKGLSAYSARNSVTVHTQSGTLNEITNGFPPAYGYIPLGAREEDTLGLGSFDVDHVIEPYTSSIGHHEDEGVYQVSRWAFSFDANEDGSLSLLEYLPVGRRDTATSTYSFSQELYTGSNTPGGDISVNEVQAQLSPRARPYVYVPFNKRQLIAATRYWVNNNDAYGANFDTTDADLAGRMFFPPPEYDGFVLIGNGPGGNDGGLSSVAPPGTPGVDYDVDHLYHVVGLRIAFLATRDWDPDGPGVGNPLKPDDLPDFDFQSRKKATDIYNLPDGSNGFGAFILTNN